MPEFVLAADWMPEDQRRRGDEVGMEIMTVLVAFLGGLLLIGVSCINEKLKRIADSLEKMEKQK